MCHKCGLNKRLDFSKMENTGKGFKFRCRCREVYEVDLRRYYRKPVRLPAECENLETGAIEKVVLKDMSLSGVCFTAPPFSRYRISDRLDLNFALDNQRNRPISIRVEVRNIRQRDIGTEIVDMNYHEKDLYYYLLP